MTTDRYALEHTVNGAKFCPEVGTLLGFDGPVAAMRHIFEVLPNEAHLWKWVPIQQPARKETE